jgi:hypothetical protein
MSTSTLKYIMQGQQSPDAGVRFYQQIRQKVLIIHGGADKFIDTSEVETLFLVK